jgi:hypothetical protein
MAQDFSRKITDLGLEKDQIDKLTPAAKNLTYGDLVHLGTFAKSPKEKGKSEQQILDDFEVETKLKLTIKDVRSFEEAFEDRSHYHVSQIMAAGPACCCCTCTPCCSCCA